MSPALLAAVLAGGAVLAWRDAAGFAARRLAALRLTGAAACPPPVRAGGGARPAGSPGKTGLLAPVRARADPGGAGAAPSGPGPARHPTAVLVRTSSGVAALAAAAAVLATSASLAAAASAGLVAAIAVRGLRAGALSRAELAGVDAVRGLLRALSVELRSGTPAAAALARCTRRSGAVAVDVPALLRSMAEAPGHGALARLAALWQVADSTGAGLAEGLDRLADELDAEVELRREIDTVLAGPRASARLMAVLPLGGLLLGAGLGGDPVGFLLHDPLGAACLLAGVGLVVTGLAWTRALARSAVA